MADTTPPEQQLLTAQDVQSLISHAGYAAVGVESRADFINRIRHAERALLARLSEQRPVCWGIFDQAGFLEEAMDEAGAKRSVEYYNTMGPLTPYTCRPLYAAPVPTPAASDQERDDINALVRRLDVALNGEDGAARQASLCDIVSQVEAARTTPAQAAQAVPADVLAMHRRDAERWRALEAAVDSSGVTVAIPDSGGDQWDGHAINDMGDLQDWADKQVAAAPTPTGAGDDQGGAR